MEDWNIGTIILAYDGSPGAERAAHLAVSVARHHDALVVVLTAAPRYPRVVTPKDTDDLGFAEAQMQANAVAERLAAKKVNVEVDVPEGPASEAILNAADVRHADLIVVGGLGRSRTAELLMGSTSKHVVQHAKVPVLVAR